MFHFSASHLNCKQDKWGERRGLNPRPPESQSGALPTELRSPQLHPHLVRPPGLEPGTYALEGRCSIQLSYGRSVISFSTAPTTPFWRTVAIEVRILILPLSIVKYVLVNNINSFHPQADSQCQASQNQPEHH